MPFGGSGARVLRGMTTSTGPLGRLLLLACVTAFLSSDGIGARLVPQWPGFRGANGTGIADRDTPPITFGPSEKLLWKRATPPGHSSPVVWDDRVFLTAVDGTSLSVMALRRSDGVPLWSRAITPDRVEEVHPSASQAASTPVTDGRRVYAYFPTYGLIAFDLDGQEVWRRALPFIPMRFGTGTSPILAGGKVVLQRDGASADAELLALDAASGEVAWGDDVLYASSFYATGVPERPLQIEAWSVLSERYDANRDGKLTPDELPADARFTLRPDVPTNTEGSSMTLRRLIDLVDQDKDGAMTQAEFDGSLASLRSRTNTVLAIRPGGAGDCTSTHVAWKDVRGVPEIASPLFYRNRLYLVRDGGLLTSYAPDGTLHIDRKRLGVLGQYASSPVAADGRIYAASVSGTIVVFRAGDTLEVLARNDLGEPIMATPAIAANTLYVRSVQHIWAFGERP